MTTHIRDLKPDSHNRRKHTPRNVGMIETALNEVGAARSIVVDEHNVILAGNATVDAAAAAGIERVQIVEADGNTIVAVRRRGLTDEQKRKLALYDNRSAELAEWNVDQLLADVNDGLDLSAFFRQDELDALIKEAGRNGATGEDKGPQVDKASELQAKWSTRVGQVWQLGEHRLACGDCTDRAVVEAVMRGERAVLCHADPPYGMGKESEGIANDNLYREKLDAFQMAWWCAGRSSLEDNASVYIWGNAEDLWRLWYCGGLRDSERLTLRNEIVWDKGNGQGQQSEGFRSYAPATERCLFFMLGEQGFNINADNYWTGWDGIVDYLERSRQAMGWSIKDTKRIAGHSEKSGCHWFDKSQWSMPTEETYKRWQAEARGDAFKREYDDLKREYDDLKREFYATRAHFDNTHDNMTDVWRFERVQGEERHGHATPKPLGMAERAIKSSAPSDAPVYAPFSGTGPELIACERLNRKARCIELDEGYTAVCIQRWVDMTGKEPRLLSN